MGTTRSIQQIQELIGQKLAVELFTSPQSASDEQFYHAAASVVKEILTQQQREFHAKTASQGRKQVHYLSMEFLPGRSLKNNLYNLGLTEVFTEALREMGATLENLYDYEPDAGLGNGGLGRLAACYLDGLATEGFPAMGYSILYEYGIFKQKIVNGWQTELPDYWIPGGDVWLSAHPGQAVTVRFGGRVEERWEGGYHRVIHTDYTPVQAVPHDLYISGYDSEAVSTLRLFKASSPGVDMDRFHNGDYVGAFARNALAETVSKVLYPNDSHIEGKSLRLRQQYFLSAAAVGDIIRRHLKTYGSLDSFSQKNALQINDTHPVLAIPEMMRVLLDECGYGWDAAYKICAESFSYTNHTVMKEALEVWDEGLVAEILPRIYSIIKEIDRRHRLLLSQHRAGFEETQRMAILSGGMIRMANLACAVCHSINGVSKLHSEIIIQTVFGDYYKVAPQKFKNVTNGIASRRWLCQANPRLTALLKETIGDGFERNLQELAALKVYADDTRVLDEIARVKRGNKEDFAAYIYKHTGQRIDPATIFDVQVKRLHEYKRQQMNALNILSEYLYLRDHPDAPYTPKTYIFGAKAAPGYYLAKQIIKLICTLADVIDKDPKVGGRLKILYLEDYKVTLSEALMPASEISQQISLASTEASGTGNMKLMLSGAITLGTMDGANVEIAGAVGEENILIFGMSSREVTELRTRGYNPQQLYHTRPHIRRLLEALVDGTLPQRFDDLYNTLKYTDSYMTLADFDSYQAAVQRSSALYHDTRRWSKMSLVNTATSGIFCADRAVKDYARDIWGML